MSPLRPPDWRVDLHEKGREKVLFILGCIGVVFIGAVLIFVTLAWLAADNAMFSDYSWFEWITFGSELSSLSWELYLAVVAGLGFVGYWIGHATGMW